jgi:phosphatidylinositol dimannoside acyltransferase
MNLQRILNSRQAGLWALRFSRMMPHPVGERVCGYIADMIASREDLPLIRSIRLNRWVVSDCQMDTQSLDLAVRKATHNLVNSYYTLFHDLNRPEALQDKVLFSAEVDAFVRSSQENPKGFLVAGLHMSNFDLVVQAACWRGLKAVAISLPEDTEHREAIEWQHKIRRQTGLEILPASVSSFRTAIRRMKAGGIVMTGVDRPIPNPKQRPIFFGRPAHLPVHYVHLAIEADVPLVLVMAILQPDGLYHICASPEIRMRRMKDRQKETLYNAEAVLEIASEFIRQDPNQWNVIQPIWPDLAGEMP